MANNIKESDEKGMEEEMQEQRPDGGTTMIPNATENHTPSEQPTTRAGDHDLEGTTAAATWPQPVSTRTVNSADDDDERYPRIISVPTKSMDGGAAEQGPSFSSSS